MAEITRNDMEKVKELSPEVFDFLGDPARCGSATPEGRIDITDTCYAIVSAYTTASRDAKEYESHRKYIDVQMLIEGKECIEVAPIGSLEVTQDYSAEKDVLFYANSRRGDDLLLEPGKPVILLPEDGHMPGLSVSEPVAVKKVVVKIPV